MYLARVTFVNGVASQSMMFVDGDEILGKALKKMILESLPESRLAERVKINDK